MSYVVANRVFLKQQYSQEVEQRFRNRAGQINQQPGFVLMEVLKPQSEKTPYVVLTHWRANKPSRTGSAVKILN